MATQDQTAVKIGPGQRSLGTGYTGGGPIPDYYVPCFNTMNSATLEVHFIGGSGNELVTLTYTLSSTNQGVLALSRSGSTFLADISLYKRTYGFIAYARGGSVGIGRGGLDQNNDGSAPNANYIASPFTSSILPETLFVGEAFAWGLIAGAHGWAVDFVGGSTANVGPPSYPALDHSWGSVITNVSKTAAGFINSLSVQSNDTNVVYFQLFDRKTALAGGETPIKTYQLGAGSATAPTTLILGATDFGPAGLAFATGITWGISSTAGTYTGTADAASLFLVELRGE